MGSPADPDARNRRASWFGTLGFAVLAYLPAFLSSPGRMPADTKLYLYLDPGRQLADSLNSWDGRQFAGWVPHQTVGYLWPTGPYYWLCDRIGLPDWIAHRFWIGSLLFAAALGVRWCARHFGIGGLAGFVAGFVYAAAPYVLPYIGRTSVLLPPWAALGWLLGLTIRVSRRRRWADVASFALVIATIGGINATALLMITPMPLLWFADQAARRVISWRQASVDVMRIGGASLLASLWWIVPLAVQGRYGAAALSYSESLEAVSLHSNATESLRGLGYWLLYVVDGSTPLTSSGHVQQTSVVVMGAAWALILLGLAGIIAVRWAGRRFAALSVLAALVLAVGVHPIDDSSPLFRPLASASRGGAALALRSSTRALPILLLMVALGIGAALATVRRRRPAALVGAVVVFLAAANNPTLFRAGLVDAALDRQQSPPQAWLDAARAVDAEGDGRVLYLPGAESGVYRWGTTVDPPLPGLVRKRVVGRDWLPLGAPGAMDLLYALDDRVQDETLDPSALAPIARLLGVDTVFFTSDGVAERFGTADPAVVWQVLQASVLRGDMRLVGRFGQSNDGVPQTAVLRVEPAGVVGRVAPATTLVAGSGAGLVDAAAAGLIDGHSMIAYAADQLDSPHAAAVIVTDSNRKQAHQWRGSQDVLGMTEDAVADALDRPDIADNRLPVFASGSTADQTTAVQVGPVTARATSYGSSLVYWPEYRAVMALDDDPTTTWATDRGVGEILRLLPTTEVGPARHLRLVQRPTPRWVSRVILRSGRQAVGYDLTAGSNGGADVLDLARLAHRPGAPISIEIAATGGASDGLVGFATARLDDSAPTVEDIHVPEAAGRLTTTDRPLSFVFTRWRVAASDTRRQDPEPVLRRSFDTVSPVRLSLTFTDNSSPARGAGLTSPDEEPCRDDVVTLDGVAVPVRPSADSGTRQTVAPRRVFVSCGDPIELSSGTHLLVGRRAADGVSADSVVLSAATAPSASATPEPASAVALLVDRSRDQRRMTVPPCPRGCWVSLGEGWSDGWSATAGGHRLGTPSPIDGGMSGWWLDPTDSPTDLVVTWRPQRAMDLGMAASALSVVAMICIVGASRRRGRRDLAEAMPPAIEWFRPRDVRRLHGTWRTRSHIAFTAAATAVGLAVIDVPWGLAVGLVTALGVMMRRGAVAAIVGLCGLGVVAVGCIARVAITRPTPGALWTASFEQFHRPTMASVLLVVCGAFLSSAGRNDPADPIE